MKQITYATGDIEMAFSANGIIVPIVTPIDRFGEFDETAYRRLIEYLIQNGVSGIFPFGTTGEFYAFDEKTYERIISVTVDAVAQRAAVYAGANHITTNGAIQLVEIAAKAGADAVSVLTPMFISQTQEEIYNYYSQIAAESELPIIIYNNRPKTNVTVEPKTLGELCKVSGIVGIKDSTGDMTNTEEYLRLTRKVKNFDVLIGRDTLILAGLHYGASGAIASCANVAPALTTRIYNCFMAGDYTGALDAQFELAKLRIATNMGTFPVVLKEALKIIGYDCGNCVKPILPLNEEIRNKLKEVLHEIHLI